MKGIYQYNIYKCSTKDKVNHVELMQEVPTDPLMSMAIYPYKTHFTRDSTNYPIDLSKGNGILSIQRVPHNKALRYIYKLSHMPYKKNISHQCTYKRSTTLM